MPGRAYAAPLVFPAGAGVNRGTWSLASRNSGIPRRRGGEPGVFTASRCGNEYSPQARG